MGRKKKLAGAGATPVLAAAAVLAVVRAGALAAETADARPQIAAANSGPSSAGPVRRQGKDVRPIPAEDADTNERETSVTDKKTSTAWEADSRPGMSPAAFSDPAAGKDRSGDAPPNTAGVKKSAFPATGSCGDAYRPKARAAAQ
ncbi:hypothetical protein [Paenibacillus humicola]|uniref:hypothetical protein n=1 Tax=Paenibacillus humicola TaxID=3110540 RepID=UPI00237BF2B8|nr:hypothetical protein [Paenibacillus humicola]